jgi:hypothetical protein
MTTFQDQPPQSRRALREQLLNERSRSGEIDDSAEADRPAPSGRRAQRPEAPASLVEVPVDAPTPDASVSVTEQSVTDQAETRQRDEQAAHDDVSPAHQLPVSTPWIAAEVEGPAASDTHTDDDHEDAAEPASPVVDSAIATPFPFADQVEATSDDAGQPGFRLRDFTPELNAARADTQSASDWTPAGESGSVPLEYHTQGGPGGHGSPSSRRAQRAEAPASVDSVETGERPSFDSLFADLTVDDSADETPAHEAAEPETNDAEATEPEATEPTTDEHADAEQPDSQQPAAQQPDSQQHDAQSTGDIPAAPVVGIPVGEPVVVNPPAAAEAPLEIAPEERTLSRREWRLMRARAEAEAAAAGAHAGDDTSTTPPAAPEQPRGANVIPPLVEPAPEAHTPLSDAMAEFEALTRGTQSVDSSAETSFPSFPVALSPGYASRTGSVPVSAPAEDESEQDARVAAADDVARDEATTTADAPAASSDAAPEQADAASTTADVPVAETPRAPEDFAPRADATTAPAQSAPFSFLLSPPVESTPVESTPVESTSAESMPATAAGSDEPAGSTAPAEPAPTTGPYTPPVGHWSRQAEMDDESQPFENTLSRDVGGGNVATTTNALVLPMIPERDDFSSVLNATGEIMVTGTINLPGSVGSTGRDSRHYDDPEVDHLFDAFDNEIANTDSAPVRAITAVSSHTATRGGIETGRKQSNRMLNVLLVTASVLAVGVLALLVAGFVLRIF